MALDKLPSLYEQLNSTPTSQDYKVHTFTSGTNNFVVTTGGDVEYLVVAGGGSGGASNAGNGGGGGAGGMLTGTFSNLSTGTYPAVVGAGGTRATSGTQGGNGGTSSINSISTSGGGAGGHYPYVNARSGGSGGGGGQNNSGGIGGGANSGISGQGNAGGKYIVSVNSGGGGGGASQVGADALIRGGFGGDGLQSYISGTFSYYAGGGGGSSHGGQGSTVLPIGGFGGGGMGNYNLSGSVQGGVDGTANTGGGGGGAGENSSMSIGGSGIVIVRYKTSSGVVATGGTVTNISQVSGVAKQRFVDTFSGSALDTDRWGIFDGTVTPYNAVDGGVLVTSGTAQYAGGTFGFANSGSTIPAISPFGNPCTMIYNLRSATVVQPNTHGAGMVGQIRGDMAGNNSALWCERASFTKWKQRNINSSGSQSDVQSTEPYTQDNQDWHNFRLDLDASVTKGSIDGVLASSNSTYTPASGTKLCPMFGIQNQGNGSSTSIAVNYCEVYNR